MTLKLKFMKYFAEYVPGEEGIKGASLVFYNNQLYEQHKALSNYPEKTFIIPVGEHQGIHVLPSECRPAKLSLCTRDIKVGDKVKHPSGTEGVVETEVEKAFLHESWFKVVGEISLDATWVKRGMEFEEDEVRIWMVDPEDIDWYVDYNSKKDWSEELDIGFEIQCTIKCPCCGDFK